MQCQVDSEQAINGNHDDGDDKSGKSNLCALQLEFIWHCTPGILLVDSSCLFLEYLNSWISVSFAALGLTLIVVIIHNVQGEF